MSCQYLDESHYEYVASELIRLGANEHHWILTDSRFWEPAFTLELVNGWQEWNLTAYKERYADKVSDVAKNNPLKKCPRSFTPVNLCQLLKALECIHYQCVDARNFSDSDSGKALTKLIDRVTQQLIELLPEYKNAKWSISA